MHFPNSGRPAAQRPFLRGIALLHSFEYDDAADAFRAAELADSGFALPYWFEAFTHSHLLWGEDDTGAAHAVLRRLGRTPSGRLARVHGDHDRRYASAIEAFYADTDLVTRTHALADSLTQLADRDSVDLEAAAFASLALQMADAVGAFSVAQERAMERRAITYAERVFAADSLHPGAAHYLIHIVDLDPTFASQALPAARAYARIAPDAEHALHMPSHVFLPLGLWSDVAASNERSWAASRAWVAKRKLSGAELDFHSLEWLEYAYLEQGRWRAARALIDTARAVLVGADLSTASHIDARYVASDLEFLFAEETGQWKEATLPMPSTTGSTSHRERMFALLAMYEASTITAMRGDTTGLAAAASAFRSLVGTRTGPGGRRLDIIATELEAWLAARRGDSARHSAFLTRAAAMSDSEPPVGPPLGVSARELLGAQLLASGRPADAATQYEDALAIMPNRSAALLALARARAAAHDSAGSATAYRRLLDNWRAADSALPALDEVRRGAK